MIFKRSYSLYCIISPLGCLNSNHVNTTKSYYKSVKLRFIERIVNIIPPSSFFPRWKEILPFNCTTKPLPQPLFTAHNLSANKIHFNFHDLLRGAKRESSPIIIQVVSSERRAINTQRKAHKSGIIDFHCTVGGRRVLTRAQNKRCPPPPSPRLWPRTLSPAWHTNKVMIARVNIAPNTHGDAQ